MVNGIEGEVMDIAGDKFDTSAAGVMRKLKCDWQGGHNAANACDAIAQALRDAFNAGLASGQREASEAARTYEHH